MRKWLALIAGLCLALTITVPVAAANTVVINPFDPATTTVAASDTVVLEVRWGACTRGLDQAFARAAHVAWSIDGAPFPTTPAWTAPEAQQPVVTSDCVSGSLTGWRTYDQHPTTFTAGIHTVSVVMWTTHALPDGGDYDGDGKPDLFGGPGVTWTAELTLTVT